MLTNTADDPERPAILLVKELMCQNKIAEYIEFIYYYKIQLKEAILIIFLFNLKKTRIVFFLSEWDIARDVPNNDPPLVNRGKYSARLL